MSKIWFFDSNSDIFVSFSISNKIIFSSKPPENKKLSSSEILSVFIRLLWSFNIDFSSILKFYSSNFEIFIVLSREQEAKNYF